MICFIVNGKAQNVQPNWVFQTPQSGNSSYVARDYILLKPGFSYKANKEESFHAYTNPCLLFPPSDNTYEQQRIQFLFLVRRELTACSLICLWFIIANPVTVLPVGDGIWVDYP